MELESGVTNISVSLVDYIGKMDDGIAVILSLEYINQTFEMIYWFNKSSKKRLVIENNFYKYFPLIRDIMEYEYLIDLLYHIDTKVLPDKKEIFAEFFNQDSDHQ